MTEQDLFGLIAFDSRAETWNSSLLPATRENRSSASEFLNCIDARGGTELARGFTEAARMLNEGGDVLILTDGQVSGTEEILAQARKVGARLSCLGIGSASQDRFLSLLARETGGVSRFVTPRERVDMEALELFASIGQPVATELKASESVRPEPPQYVFAGTPLLVVGEIANGEEDCVELTWHGGSMSISLPSGDAATGKTVRLLQGSRLITDWESRYPGKEAVAPLEARRKNRIAARLVQLSESYGLASREVSLVAVIKRPGDRPGQLPETRVVSVGMPEDVSFDSYFDAVACRSSMEPCTDLASSLSYLPESMPKASRLRTALFSVADRAEVSDDGSLVKLAASLEPDGGMPGATSAERLARTIAALLAFVADHHTITSGAFRLHVARLVKFLESATVSSAREKRALEQALQAASTGIVPPGEWLALATIPRTRWKDIEAAFR